eukprot:Phypoly_transcript_12057.p1 GENE.Phypoly_transcript_12057~~Phypoly_transcript_12057.p1  ORF type:complete len:198 (+),score=29.17 Phypoly_transcript_12057:72-665(+)
MTKPIILGSSSIHRKQVLQGLGINFTVMSPDIDEKAIRDPNPSILTKKIAKAKADALLERISKDPSIPPSILIASDQVVVYKGVIREKPETKEECKEYLTSYREGPATCVVSICVVDTKSKKCLEATVIASQHFKYLPDEFIQQLIVDGVVMTCAGGFTVEKMEGYLGPTDGEIETIMGLPKSATLDLLAQIQNIKD